VDEYSAECDPGAAHTVYRKAGPPSGLLSAQTGKLHHTLTADEKGWPIRAELPMGGAKMIFERAWSKGVP
jgi:hypothetical protein